MAISNTPSPLSNIISAKTYNAAWFSGSTKEAQITNAISSAAMDGALYVYVPANMLPYNAALVTFNNTVQMIREGGNPSVIDVQAYGAAGDGIADDTAEIQAAATALSSSKTLVAIGSFKINGQITITTSGIVLDLAKATFTQTGTSKSTIILSAVSDVEVKGGRFVGKGTEHNGANTAWNGVAAIAMKNGCTNISIHGVKATNHAGGSIRWDTSINGLRVYDCKLVGIGAAGGIVVQDNNDDVAIGGYATNPDNDVIITNNDISGHCFGIQVAYGTRCLIGWNSFHDIPGQHAIYNAAQSRVLIIGNIFQNIALIGCKNQIADAATICTDISVIGNQFNTCGQTAIATLCVNFTNSYYNRVKVSGNHIYNCTTSYGIQCDYVREYDCSDNTVIQCGAYGIYGAHCYGHVRNNTVKLTSWNGIALTSINHDTEVSGNKIVDAVQNFEVGGDSNDRRYLIFLQKDAASLVANPKVLVFDNTFRTTVAEGGFYLAVVFAATGTFVYYYGANKNLTTKTAISMQTATDLQQCDVIANVAPTYGVNVFFDRSLGDAFNVIATNGTAFTLQPPSNSTPGFFTIKIKNTSGGALGVATFGAAYKLGAAWVQPATGFSRSITFYHDGANPIEVSRTAVDVAN